MCQKSVRFAARQTLRLGSHSTIWAYYTNVTFDTFLTTMSQTTPTSPRTAAASPSGRMLCAFAQRSRLPGKLTGSLPEMPNIEREMEAELSVALQRAAAADTELHQERRKRSAVDAELACEKEMRVAVEAELAHETGMRVAVCELLNAARDNLEHAQMVLNCRLLDARELANMTCCVGGCLDPSCAQTPLVRWACRCTQPRHACMHCVSQSMASFEFASTTACGFKCPYCACLTTKWAVVNCEKLLPERWSVGYRALDD